MITNSQTNFLYLADTLPKKYPKFYSQFEKVLHQCNLEFELLPNTKDIWAVDYMPIQTEQDRFVRFTYTPSYLKTKKYLKTITDVDSICKEININTDKTNIILDGGNIINSKNTVIMTERVFIENPTYQRKELINKLHEILQIDKLFFIPEQPNDFTGHADGMIRFIDETTLLINDYSQEKEWFRKAFEIAIRNTGLDFQKITYPIYNNKNIHQANGDYINYLQMNNTIIIPTFGIKEDNQAVKQLETIFSEHTIKTIDSNEIANDGGVLNCITWNILK